MDYILDNVQNILVLFLYFYIHHLLFHNHQNILNIHFLINNINNSQNIFHIDYLFHLNNNHLHILQSYYQLFFLYFFVSHIYLYLLLNIVHLVYILYIQYLFHNCHILLDNILHIPIDYCLFLKYMLSYRILHTFHVDNIHIVFHFVLLHSFLDIH